MPSSAWLQIIYLFSHICFIQLVHQTSPFLLSLCSISEDWHRFACILIYYKLTYMRKKLRVRLKIFVNLFSFFKKSRFFAVRQQILCQKVSIFNKTEIFLSAFSSFFPFFISYFLLPPSPTSSKSRPPSLFSSILPSPPRLVFLSPPPSLCLSPFSSLLLLSASPLCFSLSHIFLLLSLTYVFPSPLPPYLRFPFPSSPLPTFSLPLFSLFPTLTSPSPPLARKKVMIMIQTGWAGLL